MKLFIATLCLSMTAAFATERNLVDEADWVVEYDESSFEYDPDTNTVTFDFERGPLGNVFIDVATDGVCPNGNLPFLGVPSWLGITSVDDAGPPLTTTVSIVVDESIAPELSCDFPGPNGLCNNAAITFCVRYGLKMGEDMLINFRQVQITLSYNLENEFTFEFMTIAKKEAVEREAERVPVRAELCAPASGGNELSPLSFIQGEVICVRVCPDEDLSSGGSAQYYGQALGMVTAQYENADLTTLSQSLVDNNGYPVDELAWVDCDMGPEGRCCEVKFLLKSIFFPSSDDYTTVSMNGWAYFSIGNDAEGGDNSGGIGDGTRRLQESGNGNGAANFDVEVSLASNGEDASAASVVSVTMAAAGLAGAALLL